MILKMGLGKPTGTDGPRSVLTCSSYSIPMVDLFKPASYVPSPSSLVQDLDGWPAAVSCTGERPPEVYLVCL